MDKIFPTFPNVSNDELSCLIKSACELINNTCGIPYDFNGTLSLESKFNVLFKTVLTLFEINKKLIESYTELYNFVNNYFSDLNLQEEINNKLNDMLKDGSINEIFINTFGNSKKLRGYNIQNIVCFGDSYSVGTIYSPSSSHTIVTDHGWAYYLKELYNYNVSLYGSGGAGFVRKATSGEYVGKNFLEIANTAVTELGENIKNIELVILSGGINDSVSDFEKLDSAIYNTLKYLIDNFTSADILIGTTVLRGDRVAPSPGDLLKTKLVVNNCFKTGCAIIENSVNIFTGQMSIFNSGDDIHPTEEGYKYMAQKFQSYINGGSLYDFDIDYINNSNGELAMAEGFKSSFSSPVRWILENGTFNLKGSFTINNDMTSATRAVLNFREPPANYGTPSYGTAILYNPEEQIFIGTTIFDLVNSPDGVHTDLRLQRMFNNETGRYDKTIPAGTRVYIENFNYCTVF